MEVKINHKPLVEKYTYDEQTAILTTDKWGLNIDTFRYDPVIIKLVLQRKIYNKGIQDADTIKLNDLIEEHNNNIKKKIIEYCDTKYDFQYHEKYWPDTMKLHWVPNGTYFIIKHCGDDGESIVTIQSTLWNKA